jgi:putative ABC transport system permease protein
MLRFQFMLAARYLAGRKLRSFLTTLSIVFGALLIFGMNILLPTMLKSFEANLLGAAGQVDVTVTLKTGEAFPRRVLNTVKGLPGIRAAAPLLSRTANIPDGFYGRSSVSALTFTGIDTRLAQTLHNYVVQEGRFLRPDDPTAVLISASLGDTLGLKLGDKLRLPTTEGSAAMKIVGLLPARTLPGNEEVLMTLAQAQKLLDLNDRINTIEINLDTTDPAQREAIQQSIAAAVGSDYVLGGLSTGAEVFASIQTGKVAINLFGVMALIMGGFIIFNTFRTIVAERRHDIGMLRAIGASRGTIVGLILAEGILQGVVGTAIGMGLGYLMGAGLVAALAPTMTKFIHVQMGAPVIESSLIVLTIALGVGVTLLAGLLPAFSANRVTPLEALRPSSGETPPRVARRGAVIGAIMIIVAVLALIAGNPGLIGLGGLLFMVGLVLIAPALVKPIASLFSALIGVLLARDGVGALAQGNLVRQPSRAAITASATMIGLALIVAAGGVIWSITGGFLGILQRSLGSDYLLMPPAVAVWKSNIGANQDLAERLRNVHGVAVVSTLRYAAASINGDAVSLLGIDPLTYPQVASLTFQQGDAASAFAAMANERALICNGIFAAQAKLKVGDVVALSTPTGEHPYRIVAVAGDYLNAKVSTAYISQANLQSDFRKNEDVFIQLNLSPNADTSIVEPQLKAVLAAYPQFKLISGKSYFEENRQLFDATFAAFYILLGVLATPSLIALLNTLAIGVIERTREIGMLRAIGATQRQVRRMVIIESLLLAAMGTAFGLLGGLYLGYVLVLGLSTGGFPVTYGFPYAGLVAAVAMGLLFGVLAALVPARQAAHMQIIRALRYE